MIERESVCQMCQRQHNLGEGQKEREKEAPAEEGAQEEAGSQDPKIMT